MAIDTATIDLWFEVVENNFKLYHRIDTRKGKNLLKFLAQIPYNNLNLVDLIKNAISEAEVSGELLVYPLTFKYEAKMMGDTSSPVLGFPFRGTYSKRAVE